MTKKTKFTVDEKTAYIINELGMRLIHNVTTNFEYDLRQRKKNGGKAIFCDNKKQDIAEIKRHLDAFKIVLDFFEGGE